MKFHNSYSCTGTSVNQDCTPERRPAAWFAAARNKASLALRNAVNEYRLTLCSQAVAEKAIQRYNLAKHEFCEDAELITEDGKKVVISDCIVIPGVSAGDPDTDNAIKTSQLGENAELNAKMYLTIMSLSDDFDKATDSEQKKIFSMIFSDDTQRFDSICEEVIG